jgi:PTH1 family peptidyl-tRNA hydrolase
MWLLVGLGNPGSEYERTRHNLGFMVIDHLVERASAGPAKAKFGGELREGTLRGERVLLLKPMEYMNLSGQAVGKTAGFWKVAPAQVLVIHDELDLPWARMRVAAGGGPGGHNGLKSIISALGNDFPRLRLGIGKPPSGREGASYVLSGFNKDEQAELPTFIADASDAVEAVLTQGITAAMNKFNAAKNPKKTAAERDKTN